MAQVTRIIRDAADLSLLWKFVRSKPLPFTVVISDGVKRTNPQNRLQRLWCKEAADQLGDETAEEKRGYCKLHFGVAILKNVDDEFAAIYDKHIRPNSYESKLAMMQVPIDMPVTSRMKVAQKKEYLDAVYQHFTALGVKLTDPEELKYNSPPP